MSQISQPVRIALLAVIVLAAAWFLLLRPHPPASAPSTPTPTPAAAPSAPPAAAGSASLPPGVAGFSRAIQHARDAVTASRAQVKSAEQANPAAPRANRAAPATATAAAAKAGAGAPSAPAPAATPATASAPVAHAATAPPTAPSAASAARVLAGPPGAAAAPAAAAAAARAAATPVHPGTPPAPAAPPATHAAHISAVAQVQQEIGEGKVVVILFWNPHSADDQSVRAQLRAIDHQDGIVVTHVATPDQVTEYGTVTTTVQVTGTPTIVIINPKGQASTLTGLVDSKTIDQAVNDAEQAAGTDQLPQLTAFIPGSPRAAYVNRANAMCRREIHKAGHFDFTSSTTLSQAVAWVSAVNYKLLADLLRITPPAQDGAYIDTAVGHERRAVSELHSEMSAISANDASRARADLLSLQADDDRFGIMLTTYGLSDCVPH